MFKKSTKYLFIISRIVNSSIQIDCKCICNCVSFFFCLKSSITKHLDELNTFDN